VPFAARQETLRFRFLRGRGRDPEPLARAPQQQRIPERLRRRQQQQTPLLVGQRLELPHEAALDLARDPARR
jgi:hypothetical protein